MNKSNQDIVFCFSGTGNSLASAKIIAERLGCEVRCINSVFMSRSEKYAYNRVVIIFPSYAYGLPKPVKEFLKANKFTCNYLALAVTFGTSPGGTLYRAERLLKKRVDHFKRIKSVENYIPFFGTMPPDEIKKWTQRQNDVTREFAEEVFCYAKSVNKHKGSLLLPVSLLFSLFTGVLGLFIRCNKRLCTKCGLCADACPSQAIVVGKKAKILNSKCSQCQRCINICPKKALTLFRNNKKCNSYIHPDITASELRNSNMHGDE